MANGRWDIAGAYLADWVSYEVRPRIEYEDGYLTSPIRAATRSAKTPIPTGWSSNAPWCRAASIVPDTSSGSAAAPAVRAAAFSEPWAANRHRREAATAAEPAAEPETVLREETVRATVTIGSANRIDIEPGVATVTRGTETLVADIVRDRSVTARGPLPSLGHAAQPGRQDPAVVRLSRARRHRGRRGQVRHRFLGWANFVFDTYSPFWGKSAGEVDAR